MKSVLLALGVFYCGSALACSPNQNIDAYFDPNSSELKSSEIIKLADWKIRNQLNFPNHGVLAVAGVAVPSERDPEKLSRARAQVVADFFHRTNYTKAEIIVESHIYRERPGIRDNFMRTEIMMSPLPPHGCSR